MDDSQSVKSINSGNFYVCTDEEELLNIYKDLIKKYPLVSIEDPFQQEDFDAFSKLTKF